MSQNDFHQLPRTPPPWSQILTDSAESTWKRHLYDALGVYQPACDCEASYREAKSIEEEASIVKYYWSQIWTVVPRKLAGKATEVAAMDWLITHGLWFYLVPPILAMIIYLLGGRR